MCGTRLRKDMEKMERLSKDKEEAMKLMMEPHVDAATSAVNASVATNNTKVMMMVLLDGMLVISEVTKQTNINANTKPTKKKANKEPNAPKHALNSHIFFMSENQNFDQG